MRKEKKGKGKEMQVYPNSDAFEYLFLRNVSVVFV